MFFDALCFSPAKDPQSARGIVRGDGDDADRELRKRTLPLPYIDQQIKQQIFHCQRCQPQPREFQKFVNDIAFGTKYELTVHHVGKQDRPQPCRGIGSQINAALLRRIACRA